MLRKMRTRVSGGLEGNRDERRMHNAFANWGKIKSRETRSTYYYIAGRNLIRDDTTRDNAERAQGYSLFSRHRRPTLSMSKKDSRSRYLHLRGSRRIISKRLITITTND